MENYYKCYIPINRTNIYLGAIFSLLTILLIFSSTIVCLYSLFWIDLNFLLKIALIASFFFLLWSIGGSQIRRFLRYLNDIKNNNNTGLMIDENSLMYMSFFKIPISSIKSVELKGVLGGRYLEWYILIEIDLNIFNIESIKKNAGYLYVSRLSELNKKLNLNGAYLYIDPGVLKMKSQLIVDEIKKFSKIDKGN